eukprot:3124468-Rhodomonas_salina.2
MDATLTSKAPPAGIIRVASSKGQTKSTPLNFPPFNSLFFFQLHTLLPPSIPSSRLSPPAIFPMPACPLSRPRGPRLRSTQAAVHACTQP